MEKAVRQFAIEDLDEIRENLEYWLSKTPEERVSAVEQLRKLRHGDQPRLQRVARVIQRP